MCYCGVTWKGGEIVLCFTVLLPVAILYIYTITRNHSLHYNSRQCHPAVITVAIMHVINNS